MYSIQPSPKRVSFLLVFIFFTSILFGQNYTYNDSWSKQSINIAEQSAMNMRIVYSVNSFRLINSDSENPGMKEIALRGNFLPNDAGKPNLPVVSANIAIPENARVSIKHIKTRTARIEDVHIAPAEPIHPEQLPAERRFKDSLIYNKNEFFPSQPVILSDPWEIRGVDVATVSITPFRYNPVTGELIVIRDMEIELVFEGGQAQYGDERLRSKYWDPILSDMLLNYQLLPKVDYDKRLKENAKAQGCEYLIVSPDNECFQKWADSLRRFRIEQGILTKVVTLSEIGGNSQAVLESYFNNAYNNWNIPPAAVLLLGDHGASMNNSVISPVWNNFCVSDNIYADVDNDDLPDMVFSRICAHNENELQVTISKILDYENNPPKNPAFYDQPTEVLGYEDLRWFQINTETVHGYFEQVHGKNPIREHAIHMGSPGNVWSTAQNTSQVVDYFGPQGLGYIPATPQHLNDFDTNADSINNTISEGTFMVLHRDHGSVDGWDTPQYLIDDLDGCSNTDLSFILSINCYTGKFDEMCFAEALHLHTHNGGNSGALGVVAASNTSYSFVNDTYVWGFYDNLWPDFMPDYSSHPEPRGLLPSFGNAAGKYFLQQSSWPCNPNQKTDTYHLLHHHGGCFSTLYSEAPQDLNISHDDVIIVGEDHLVVSVNAGTTVALTVGDQIVGTGTSTGSPLTVHITPQPAGTVVKLVAFKTNYFRYEAEVLVIPANTPYCVYEDHSFRDDEGSVGHKEVEYGDSLLLSITLRNHAYVSGTDLQTSISTDSPYLVFSDSSEIYPLVPARDTSSVPDGFAFKIADDTPDRTRVVIDIETTEGGYVTESDFEFSIRAPNLTADHSHINDSLYGNGNGMIDPGETFDLVVRLENNGQAVAKNTMASLEVLSPYILIEENELLPGDMLPYDIFEAVYTMSIDSAAPIGTMAYFVFNAQAGSHSLSKEIGKKIGMILEDWETGDFSKYDWNFEGDRDWIISSHAFEGEFAAKSGNVSNHQKSILKLNADINDRDSISFYIKVSSEEEEDFARFYIDDSLQGAWSGIMEDYIYAAFPVDSGNHTFKWIYEKDDYVTFGDDCVWLDYIGFPPMPVLSAFAGHDNYACFDGLFQCEGVATYYQSVEWSTSGSGTFDDAGILNPVYTPSQEDYDNGSVSLGFMAIGSQGSTDSDDMVLTFVDGPGTAEKPTGPDYVDLFEILISRYETEAVQWSESYQWKIEPVEAGSTESDGRNAYIEWNPGYLGLAYISVKAINNCGEGDFSEAIEVTINSTVEVVENKSGDVRVYPNPSNGQFVIELPAGRDEAIELNIFNASGILVHNESIEGTNKVMTKEINFSKMPKGLYFISLKGHETNHSSKLILN